MFSYAPLNLKSAQTDPFIYLKWKSVKTLLTEWTDWWLCPSCVTLLFPLPPPSLFHSQPLPTTFVKLTPHRMGFPQTPSIAIHFAISYQFQAHKLYLYHGNLSICWSLFVDTAFIQGLQYANSSTLALQISTAICLPSVNLNLKTLLWREVRNDVQGRGPLQLTVLMMGKIGSL